MCHALTETRKPGRRRLGQFPVVTTFHDGHPDTDAATRDTNVFVRNRETDNPRPHPQHEKGSQILGYLLLRTTP